MKTDFSKKHYATLPENMSRKRNTVETTQILSLEIYESYSQTRNVF